MDAPNHDPNHDPAPNPVAAEPPPPASNPTVPAAPLSAAERELGLKPPGGIVGLILVTLVPAIVALLQVFGPRRYPVDDNTWKLLAIAVLPWVVPWLARSVTSLKLPGGVELVTRVEAAERAAAEAKEKGQAAQQVAADAKGEVEARSRSLEAQLLATDAKAEALGAQQAAENLGHRPDVVTTQPATAAVENATASSSPTAVAELERLAQEYVQLRSSMDAGWARTGKFNALVKRMMTLADRVAPDEILRLLQDTHWGNRLAAYSLLYAHPQGPLLTPLVRAVVSEPEEHAFGQYWGILAIGRVLALDGTESGEDVFPTLRTYLDRLKPKSDRHYELSRILRQYDRP